MESEQLKISIVTPSFNQGSFLERTIRSILDQNDPNLQYIVVDGASDDDSPAIIRKYAQNLAWSISEQDQGHADAINKGFSHSDGEIMAWLNSDDMYFPWTLQLVREIFENFPDVEWITGIPALWNTKDHLTENHKGKAYLNKWDYMAGRYEWIQQESTFWRRSLWDRAGGRIDDSGIFMIDGELWTRFFKHAELWRVETLLGGYRLHTTNRAHSASERVEEEMKSFCETFKKDATEDERWTFDQYLKLSDENRIGDLHHPCCRYPVIAWNKITNSWEKDVRYKRHEDLRRILAESTGRTEWPYKAPKGKPIPATLPEDRPWPRISIITPSYNQGRYIEQTILSIANQNYPNVEHIVIDGGSTDETLAIIEKYSPLLTYWVSERDRGQSHAINKGFAKATGEIITWLNSDDLLAPDALVAMALAFHTSDADMVAGICQLHRDGEIFDQHLTSCQDGPLPLTDLLDLENHWMSGQFFFQPEVFFKRDLLLKVGGNVNENAHWSMDYELWVRFAQAGAKLKVIGRPIVQFRVHDEQKTQDLSGFKEELRALIDTLRTTLQMPQSPPPREDRKQTLKIVFFNDLGFRYGAGIAHERLARATQLAGHEVIPISVGVDNLTDTEKSLPFAEQIVPYLKSLSPDLVLVGNIHAAGLDAEFLKELTEALPTVFLLHDGWLLSGRCAYRGDCIKNLTGCDQSCPTPNEYPRLLPEEIAPAWKGKIDLLQTAPKLVLAANSRWNEQQVISLAGALRAPSVAPVNRPLTVRLGLPLDIFYPRDQAASRDALTLPRDKFILLFSCNNLGDKRKGVDHLLQALSLLNLPDLIPVCIGYNDGNTKLDLPNLISVGLINDPEKQALLYSAADLFVAPSLEEAFGQVFIEAAACGTPSVAYPVGGVPEALADGVVGRLAKIVHPDSLAEAIHELYLNHRLRNDMSYWGRKHIENQFSLESSCNSLFSAFRAAMIQSGTDLVPKLKIQLDPIPLPPVTVLLEKFGYIKYSSDPSEMTNQQIEFVLLDYYQEQMRGFRGRPTPWWLKPKAWLARINRNNLRKKIDRIKRNACKRKIASDSARASTFDGGR